ncbi:MAG TPA: hypothetical protein VF089_00595, partial [Candidatus Binatia bacterium]
LRMSNSKYMYEQQPEAPCHSRNMVLCASRGDKAGRIGTGAATPPFATTHNQETIALPTSAVLNEIISASREGL